MDILSGLKFELEMRKGNNDDIAKLPEIIKHIEDLENQNKVYRKALLEAVSDLIEHADIGFIEGVRANIRKVLMESKNETIN